MLLFRLLTENDSMIKCSDFQHMTQKELSDSVVTKFLPVLPTNLYEQGLTALISLKTKTRNSIDAEL